MTVIGNTGDDITLFGLRVCPDLDTVMYTLGGGIHEEQGWGRADETFVVKEELAAYGVGPAWFGLGDRDIATHVVRTQMLDAGYPLSQVTEALCTRWGLPDLGVRLLPMSDDRVETHVVIDDPDGARAAARAVHFQEYWVRLHAAADAHEIVAVGAEEAQPGPGVARGDRRRRPRAAAAVQPGRQHRHRSCPCPASARRCSPRPRRSSGSRRSSAAPRCAAWPTGCSPRSASRPRRPRSRCTTAPAATAACSTAGWSTAADADAVPTVEAAGIACRAVPLLMPDVDAAAAMARSALALAAELTRR